MSDLGFQDRLDRFKGGLDEAISLYSSLRETENKGQYDLDSKAFHCVRIIRVGVSDTGYTLLQQYLTYIGSVWLVKHQLSKTTLACR
jgi:hypothetical protein